MRTAKIPKISPQFSHSSSSSGPCANQNVTQYIPAFHNVHTISKISKVVSAIWAIYSLSEQYLISNVEIEQNKEIYAFLFISLYSRPFRQRISFIYFPTIFCLYSVRLGVWGEQFTILQYIYHREIAIKGPEEWPTQISKSQKIIRTEQRARAYSPSINHQTTLSCGTQRAQNILLGD